MNDLLDRIDLDPLGTLRPQSAQENERALAFALELTEGTPALDALRGRGILASMIAEQRLQLDARARATEQAGAGFSRPSNRVVAGSRSGRVSAEGSFALPATLRTNVSRPASPGSRISANTQNGQMGRRSTSRNSDQSTAGTRSYATNGSLALANPEFGSRPNPRAQEQERVSPTRPSLRVLSGGKVAGKTRKKVLIALAVVALVTVAFAAVFMHASLARTQLGIDKLNIEITQAERMNQRLRVQVATLEAPDRIVAVAQELGLEPPRTVRFLPTAAPIALAATRIVR
jgi:cell division protein FtsL